MKENNDPVFPQVHDKDYTPGGIRGGLTKREYAAIMAMQGLLARGDFHLTDSPGYCVAVADAILTELEKKP